MCVALYLAKSVVLPAEGLFALGQTPREFSLSKSYPQAQIMTQPCAILPFFFLALSFR